jgi:hypothetical protein
MAILFFLPYFGSAFAQTYYKCTSPSGKIDFSDKPCERLTQGEQLKSRSNTLDNSGSREAALRQENQALTKRLNDAERLSASPSSSDQQQAGNSGNKSSSIECVQATRSYELSAGSIAPARAAIQARRSAMFIACGTEEPATQATQAKPSRSYFTKDQFGTTVRSDSCYWTKDTFGTSVKSAGCSR